MLGFDWDEELTEERRDALIDAFVKKVEERGLHTPAILFLEMHKPFSFLASQTMILGSGVLAPLFGASHVQGYAKLLDKRENVERLIQRIEDSQIKKMRKTDEKGRTTPETPPSSVP